MEEDEEHEDEEDEDEDEDEEGLIGGGVGGGKGRGNNHTYSSHLMGASIAHPHDVRAREWLAAASGKSAADAAVTARRWLTDVLRQERLTPPASIPQAKKGVAVTAAELRGLAAPLASDPKLALRHRALLQLTASVAAAASGGGGGGGGGGDGANGLGGGNDEADNRRRSAVACIIRDATSVAAAGMGDGAASAAAAHALASCLKAGAGHPFIPTTCLNIEAYPK